MRSETEFETYQYNTFVRFGDNSSERVWTLRKNTQDEFIVKEVYEDNCYQLPDDLSGIAKNDIGANIGAFAAACVDRGARAIFCYDPLLSPATKLFPYPVCLYPYAVVGENGPPSVGIDETVEREGVLLTGGYNTFSSKGQGRKAISIREVIETVLFTCENARIWLKLD